VKQEEPAMTDEALRRSDELLTELIEIVETARAVPMSASCVVPRERLLDLLDELREVMPPEMDEARTVIATRERVLKDAYEGAAQTRQQAVAEADTVLDDARHRAEQVLADAQAQADDAVRTGQAEHARLVAATSVHQAAARAATALREDAENYQAQVTAEAQEYDARLRAEADRYATDARAEAERYATKLTVDAENYAERTLDELSAVLHKAAATAEQGRVTLAQRRAGNWADGAAGSAAGDASDDARRPPISA
jgi:cell division septum initiation protein DivIVA